jgi:hypothetical protein
MSRGEGERLLTLSVSLEDQSFDDLVLICVLDNSTTYLDTCAVSRQSQTGAEVMSAGVLRRQAQ